MGINHFNTILKSHGGDCTYYTDISEFKGKRIAVDAPFLIYKYYYVCASNVVDETDVVFDDPDINEIERRTLQLFLDKILYFLKYDITPIICFDGNPTDDKKECIEKRVKYINKYKNTLDETRDKIRNADLEAEDKDIELFKKTYKYSAKPRWSTYSMFINVLNGLGFPVFINDEIESLNTSDGEALCATLCLPGNNYCVAAYTIDSDFHVFGGNICILESENTKLKVRTLELILNNLNFDFNKFRDLCIMLGTDYNSNIKGVGPVKCWNYINQYENIENLPLNTDILDYEKVRNIYDSSLIKLDIDQERLEIDKDKMKKYGRDILSSVNLSHYMDKIIEVIN